MLRKMKGLSGILSTGVYKVKLVISSIVDIVFSDLQEKVRY